MRIAINAISIKQGGSIISLHQLMDKFVALQPEHEYHIVVNGSLPQWAKIQHPNVHWHRFPWAERSYLGAALWYFVVFPIWMKRRRIDALFSHTSYLPPWGTGHAAMLLQDMKFFADDPELADDSLCARLDHRLKRLWVRFSVGLATRVLVQSSSAAQQVLGEVPDVTGKLHVIPHGPGYLESAPSAPRIARCGEDRPLQIAYVAFYRNYKNFHVVFESLRLLRERGVGANLHLTLDESKREVRELLAEANAYGIRDHIVNHGELPPRALDELYRGAEVFVFPSTCESFGFPQVEAMSFGLPIIAADTLVNREICSFAASFFPPTDTERLADLLQELSCNPEMWLQASRLSLRRAGDFSWNRAAKDTLAVIVQAAHLS